MNEREVKEKLAELHEEYVDLRKTYWCSKLSWWRDNAFIASDRKYYIEFIGSTFCTHDYDEHSITNYLNFLNSKDHNLHLKLNRAKWRRIMKNTSPR
jgi:hypothetical protein